MRFVVSRVQATKDGQSQDASILLDKKQRLPGRGAWTCLQLDCFEQAVQRGQLARGLRLPKRAHSDEVITALRASVVRYLD